MCQTCWEDMGSPAIDTPDVRLVAKLIADVYEFSCVGGNLHVVIDDWNIEDEHVENASDSIRENIHEADADQLAAEWAALLALKGLDEDQRASALALHDGFWTAD